MAVHDGITKVTILDKNAFINNGLKKIVNHRNSSIRVTSFYYFLLVQKVTKKDTTSKNSQILLSHNANPQIAMQNLEFTQDVDNPPTGH
jgi:hypothetical protein